MRDRIIRVYWHEPVLLDDILKNDLSLKQGLYYITRVFGEKETSIYVGIATGKNTIRNRLRYHISNWLYEYRGKKYVRIGEIVYPRLYNDQIIDYAESAILFDPRHKNLFEANISKRKSYSYYDLYRIENVGDNYQLEEYIRMHEHL